MKSFLEKNKIYFETIIAIIMTVASLVVAVAANRISEAQKEIQEKTVSPNLDISCEYDSEGKVSKVSIINNEGHLDDISIDIYPYLRIQFFESINGHNLFRTHEVFYPLVFDIGNQGLFERRLPHTKNGILCEIYDSECIGKIIKIVEAAPDTLTQVFNRFHSRSTFDIDDPKKPNDHHYEVNELSLEYMLYVEYNTVFDKSKHIEKYLINTGNKNTFGSSIYYDTGVKRISSGSTEEMMLNEMQKERQTGQYKVPMYSFILDDPDPASIALHWMDNAIELYRNNSFTRF